MFKNTSAGLDIADRTIELVVLKKSGKNFIPKSLSNLEIEEGVVERGEIKNEEKLLEALKKLFSGAKPKKVSFSQNIVFGIPDALSYTHVFKTEDYKKKEEKELIEIEIKTSIPEDFKNLVYDYKILNRHKNNAEIIIYAVKKRELYNWQQFFKKNKLDIKVYDIEVLANFRGVFEKDIKKPICLIDVGFKNTNISIFNKNSIELSFSIPIAGENFTNAIAKAEKLDFNKAENQKKKDGLKNKSLALTKEIDKLLLEIKKTLIYYENKQKEKVEHLVFLGGSSKMLGFIEYINKKLDLKLILAKSFIVQKNNFDLEYIGSAGLARRLIDVKFSKKDLKIGDIKFKKVDKIDLKKILPVDNKKIGVIKKKEAEVKENFGLEEKIKPKKNKTIRILLGVLVISLLVLFSVVGMDYFKNDRKENQITNFYEINQNINLNIPIAVEKTEFTTDRIRGRIIENNFDKKENEENIINQSFEKVKLELKKGEYIYNKPIKIIGEEELKIKWLIFIEDDAERIFLEKIKDLTKQEFLFNSIIYTSLTSTTNENLFMIEANINISVNNLINI